MYTLNSTEVHGVAYALQIRGGREVDSHGNKAGKGPLIKEDVMPCLDTTTPGTVTVFQPVVLESNQNHATVTQNGICPTLPASMGMGGGYVPMITEPAVCYAVDMGGVNRQA